MMMARNHDLNPSDIKLYQKMIGSGQLKNLIRTRALTLCNSRHFKQGVVYCPRDNQVLSIYHVTGHCSLTANWREDAARVLQCDVKDILKSLGDREHLRNEDLGAHLKQLEEICKPLGAIQEAAKKGLQEWHCPPITVLERLPRIHR